MSDDTICLKKFYQLDLEDPFFMSLRRDFPGTEEDLSFDEWFQQCSREHASAIVRFRDNCIDSYMAIKADAEKVYGKGTYIKWAPRFKIRSYKFANVSIFSACMTAFCKCMQVLNSEFKQSYMTVPADREKDLLILTKHMGFERVDYLPNGEVLLLRDNKKPLPLLRANEVIYHEEIEPVVRQAVNEALCAYYGRAKPLVRNYLY